MEEVFLRFGHLGKQIFNDLDYESLINCTDVSQSWKDFIHHEKILAFREIKFYSNLPNTSIKRILRKFDSSQALILAYNVKTVYKMGGIFNNQDRLNPFSFAAKKGFLEICEMIMENMEEKNPKDKYGHGVTPLHQAAEYGELEVCRLIIKNIQCDEEKCKTYQCDKNPNSDCNVTPLHKAAMNGHLQVCKLIIENICENHKPRSDQGDSKNPKSYDGTTPLHSAALRGHLKVCRLIIANVQQKNPKDRHMRTPFDYAIQKGHTRVAKFLKKYARRTKERKIIDQDKCHFLSK